MPESEKSGEKTNSRPGYTYAASFGQQQASDQFVRVKLEINGHVQIVPVCLLCHKAFRLCSLDPNVTEEMLSKAKYLGLADGVEQDSSDHHSDASDKTDAKTDAKKDVTKDATKDTKDLKDSKDSKDLKDSKDSKDTTKPGADSDKEHDKDKESAKTEEEKKKKKKTGDSDQKRKTLPKTEWTTNKPSHEEWDKKKKKDY